MSMHINSNQENIAECVLLPGDPLRAKYMAENKLDNAICYSKIRNMFGFTGSYKGKRVSIQGTGMGAPSISIYVNELIQFYNVKKLIRIGTCGSIQPGLNNKDVIIVMSACTDSAINKIRFSGRDYAPTASFKLLKKAYEIAEEKKINVKVGSVLSFDSFYNDDPDVRKIWSQYGVLAIDMETAELYTLAAKYNVEALSILTVSDNTITKERTSWEERERTFTQMVDIALELV